MKKQQTYYWAHREDILAKNKTPEKREKSREASQRWRDRHPQKALQVSRKWNIKPRPACRTFRAGAILQGIASKGPCALCGKPYDLSRKGTSPVLDHNHDTGEDREYVHSKCNVALGLLKHDSGACRKAAEYLDRHNAFCQKDAAPFLQIGGVMSEETVDSLKLVVAGLIEANDILQEEVTRLRDTSRLLRRVNSALRESVASMRRQIELASNNDDVFKRFCSGEFDAPGKFDASVTDNAAEGGLPEAAEGSGPTVLEP